MAEVGTVNPAYHSRILFSSDPLELQSNSYAFIKPLLQLPLPKKQSGLDSERDSPISIIQ